MHKKLIMWDVDSQDYEKTHTAEDIANRVSENVRSGSIVVMHDGGDRHRDNIPSRHHQIAATRMRPNSLQLLPSQSNQPRPNIFEEKQGTHVKNSPRRYLTGGPNNWHGRSRVSSPVTYNRHGRDINIRARYSQSFENLTVNRVFPVAVAEEKYPLRFHIIRIQSESVPSFFERQACDRYLLTGYDFVTLI
ncbi:hypothetical protein QUA74_08720 [Microcoleus sp. LAD1_D3]|uniref:hypothetical protein n=1 Tax=Microcoleus sp. LAD1_D3 TaxID=2819365 RepID=UPI002FD791F9